MEADDPAFRGQGWWQAERTAAGALRWAGFADRASLLLPALGGGTLSLVLDVRSPFGVPLVPERHLWPIESSSRDPASISIFSSPDGARFRCRRDVHCRHRWRRG